MRLDILQMLNADVYPPIPEQGSVGASARISAAVQIIDPTLEDEVRAEAEQPRGPKQIYKALKYAPFPVVAAPLPKGVRASVPTPPQ